MPPRMLPALIALLFYANVAFSGELPSSSLPVTQKEADAWSAKFRGWHYWPEHVVPAKPGIPGFGDVAATDVPCVYQLPGDPAWYMSFIGFDGKGYQ